MNRIIKDNSELYSESLSLNKDKFPVPVESDGMLEFKWKDSLFTPTPYIKELLDNGKLVGYLTFDNNRAGYYQCVPYNEYEFKVSKNQLRGVLKIQFVGIASEEIKVPTNFNRSTLFPKDSLTIENTSETDILLNIIDTPKALSNSVVFIEHDADLPKHYQIDYDRSNSRGELVIKVQNIKVKEELNRVANNYAKKSGLDSIAFSSSVWYPLILEILTHAYEVPEMDEYLWYRSFEELNLISPELREQYNNLQLNSEKLLLIQGRINELLYSIPSTNWTLPIFLEKFKSNR